MACSATSCEVGAPRFELGTSCSQSRRANQAALRPACVKGSMLTGLRKTGNGP